MKIESITQEGGLIVAKADGQEYAAKSAIQLVRLLVRAGMSRVQAAFFYSNLVGRMQA